MTSRHAEGSQSLFEAARAAGVEFSREVLPRDESVEANGIRFHYLEWGDPEYPTALMLHGFASRVPGSGVRRGGGLE